MTAFPNFDVRPEVASGLKDGRAIVALESTLISHGLPWPINLETARSAETAVREEGAIPATIAVIRGRPTIGLSDADLETMAKEEGLLKASGRDLAAVVAQGRTASTTVAATMLLACQAGIQVLATGGIGGAHRAPANPWDISSDLFELARTPVAVVCTGAKSILDIPRTLEILETLGVPVIGYRTNEFPAFLVRTSGRPVSARVDTPEEAAKICLAHWRLKGGGLVLAQPLAAQLALDPAKFESALIQAEKQAAEGSIHGPALTPFLLARLAEITKGKTVRANQALVVENARLAARIAKVICAAG
jgi:pseudouridine-5'-phosphate glycosidase